MVCLAENGIIIIAATETKNICWTQEVSLKDFGEPRNATECLDAMQIMPDDVGLLRKNRFGIVQPQDYVPEL